jgi:hypothetical protein
MRVQRIVATLLISTASLHAKSQMRAEFNKLVGSTDHILLVEVLHKPADTIEWLGSFRSLWVKTLRDYKGNFGNHADSIPIIIDMRDTCDISLWSHLEQGNELMVFINGTSWFHVRGTYYATVSDNAIGRRIGRRDRDGFRMGTSIVAHRELKNVIDSINRRNKIQKKSTSALERYRLSNWWTSGGHRLWAGKNSNSVYADGIYVAHWEAENKYNRHVYIYQGGRTRVLAKGSDDKILAQVNRFLIKQGCNDQELHECLTEVRFHLDNRTTEWSSSWGSAQRK